MNQPDQFDIKFVASGRGKVQCPPNPAYPHGIAVDIAPGNPQGCAVALPYPAPECGFYLINCKLCQMQIAITVAGRPDDPTSVRIPCITQASPEPQPN